MVTAITSIVYDDSYHVFLSASIVLLYSTLLDECYLFSTAEGQWLA